MYQVIVEEGIGTSRQTVHAAKLAFMSGIPVLLCQLFGRVSFAFTLLQVMGTTRNRKWFLWFMIVAQFVTNFIALVLSYGICSPLAAFWDPSLKKTSMHCLENYKRIVVDGWQYFETSDVPLGRLFVTALTLTSMGRSIRLRACALPNPDRTIPSDAEGTEDRSILSYGSWCLVSSRCTRFWWGRSWAELDCAQAPVSPPSSNASNTVYCIHTTVSPFCVRLSLTKLAAIME